MNGIKRVTLLENESEPVHKKARFNSTPVSDNEEKDSNGLDYDDNLETFRKEAIWREMEEYRRKYERSQKTITSLEKERNKCEARLSAVDLSWNQLVQEADLLLPSTSTASNGHSHSALSPSVSDPTLTDEELEEALAQRSTATKTLLGRLSTLHTTEEASTTKVDELQQTCRILLEQSQRSQESLRLLRLQHETTLEELESTHTELLRAEKRLDRSRSVTVAKIEGRLLPGASENDRMKALSADARNSSNGNSPRGSPPPSASTSRESDGSNNVNLKELTDLRALLESRSRDLEELRNDRVNLKMDIDGLKARLVELPDEVIAESVPFRLLQTHVGYLSVDYESRRLELNKASEEADTLRELQENFRVKVFAEATEQVEEIQKRLLAKEADLSRVRSQREDIRGEVTELRAKESEKVKNSEQLKLLATSREDRIAAYSSEVRRLKMQIAAAVGDSTTVDLLGTSEEPDIINDLQKRLKIAEDLLLALRDQLRSYSSIQGTFDAQTIANSETEARKELSSCRDKLVKLENLLGPSGNIELKELAKKLEKKEEVLKVLEAQLKSQDHATNMLYGEIDRLSAAWSVLDEQSSSKVFNLVHLEEKVQRLTTEKAKSDNRYFATMRQKDAIVAENAVLTKLAEKQQRMVEAADDLRHSLGTQLTAAEKEISLQQKNIQSSKEVILSLKREHSEMVMRNEQHSKHITELNSLLADRISQAEAEIAQRKKSEEQVSKVNRELKSVRIPVASTKNNANDSSEVRQLKEHNDDLSKMLKCSTCTLRFKEVIINRCGHLFCKECIEDRLSNRQRKCPSCGIAFGKDDVSNVYF